MMRVGSIVVYIPPEKGGRYSSLVLEHHGALYKIARSMGNGNYECVSVATGAQWPIHESELNPVSEES